MPMSRADLRFLFDRSTGLIQRGLTSLRTRGVQASWRRLIKHFRRVPGSQRASLYLPEAEPFAPFAVPASGAPRASIVIPVYNQFTHTLGCLRALAAHPPHAAIEIIVVDDGSSDETEAALSQVTGLRYHRRAGNGGFIAACNDGAALARGEFVVFLNNDTLPQPGWLDALLATFEQHPDTGLVGAQLLYPDGRLQEAGGLVFADGSGWNYGRFESPDAPPHAFVRDADYCSGAAIAIPRALFMQLGGFDTRYAPAYYEDTDLAFSVRAAGLTVRYQPESRVVHLEGATSGTDITQGPKAYQARNQSIFADKWRDALAGRPSVGSCADTAALSRYPRKVLLIDALTPRPDRDSGSLRLVNLMRMLREEGAHVVFLPADRRHGGADTRALQQLGVEVWYAPFAARLPVWLREHGSRFDTVLVCRHYVMREMLPLLRRHAPQARIVFDTVDLHYLRERRGAELADDPALTRAAGRTRALELDVIARSDATLVVSEIELELLSQDAPQARVDVLSNLHRLGGEGLPFEQRRDLMFVGGFRHPPNVDAVCWFVEAVWPLLRAREPSLQFHCIGGDVTAEVGALAAQPGVIVHGHVPDLTPWLAGVRLSVAPLRYGAGVKGKVNQPMAHGQPVVATTCAIEGMHLRPGLDVLVADDAAGFAEAVLRGYHDAALWQQLADNGRANVERHFSLDAGRAVVRRVLLGRD
ncbi:glycosyl transferase [Lysobacter concretionis Ko07 = DSM 16239]|uniref:Glycosyl transferase n=1 Tax=Lysobacter concretionis Ko07 = DSM 16239 TaxID=1122185 RepID=A0A0A0EQ10_9GAMM|nr:MULTISPECIES: glycosyltransferase [Lysobacter]KGM53076.1 glycosyl transferase [Lysobacter concretionis Ko07 = DSM 16239]QOD91510.1 glycosyltransferase [Lysobacter sp. CW239]